MTTAYQDLRFTDDFLFCKIMQNNPDLCKELVELIIDRKIGEIIIDDSQQSIKITKDGKGIRLDVYLEDDRNTIYDIEMQTTNKGNLPKRTRYYQGLINLNLIESGDNYNKLKMTYIIFIDTFDLFNKGLHKYTFKTVCLEDRELVLEDDATKILLNAKGTADDVSEGMKNFLKYLTSGIVTSPLTKKIEEKVIRSRDNEKWKVEYMTLEMRDQEKREEGRQEGLAEGREEVRSEGVIKSIKAGLDKDMILHIFDITEEKYEEYLKLAAATD